MGYRSDVAIGLAFVNKAAARDFVLKVQACQPEDVRQALAEYAVVLDASDLAPVLFLAYYEHIKWYPSYPEVIAHCAVINLAVDEGATTRFVRTGEDVGDDEETTDYSLDHDNMELQEYLVDTIQITRRVSCDIPPDASTPLSLI